MIVRLKRFEIVIAASFAIAAISTNAIAQSGKGPSTAEKKPPVKTIKLPSVEIKYDDKGNKAILSGNKIGKSWQLVIEIKSVGQQKFDGSFYISGAEVDVKASKQSGFVSSSGESCNITTNGLRYKSVAAKGARRATLVLNKLIDPTLNVIVETPKGRIQSFYELKDGGLKLVSSSIPAKSGPPARKSPPVKKAESK